MCLCSKVTVYRSKWQCLFYLITCAPGIRVHRAGERLVINWAICSTESSPLRHDRIVAGETWSSETCCVLQWLLQQELGIMSWDVGASFQKKPSYTSKFKYHEIEVMSCSSVFYQFSFLIVLLTNTTGKSFWVILVGLRFAVYGPDVCIEFVIDFGHEFTLLTLVMMRLIYMSCQQRFGPSFELAIITF